MAHLNSGENVPSHLTKAACMVQDCRFNPSASSYPLFTVSPVLSGTCESEELCSSPALPLEAQTLHL